MPTPLQNILKALDKDVIDRNFKVRYKDAELKFRVKFSVPKTNTEFYFNSADYWNYMNKVDIKTKVNTPYKLALGYALNIISNKYSREGGVLHALKLSQTYTFGAIKPCITDHFLNERISAYFAMVLRSYIDPYSYEQRKALILEYVQRNNVRHTKSQIESWTNSYEQFIRSHLHWLGELRLDRESRIIGN